MSAEGIAHLTDADLLRAVEQAHNLAHTYGIGVDAMLENANAWGREEVAALCSAQTVPDGEAPAQIERATYAHAQAEAGGQMANRRLLSACEMAAREATYALEQARRRAKSDGIAA